MVSVGRLSGDRGVPPELYISSADFEGRSRGVHKPQLPGLRRRINEPVDLSFGKTSVALTELLPATGASQEVSLLEEEFSEHWAPI